MTVSGSQLCFLNHFSHIPFILFIKHIGFFFIILKYNFGHLKVQQLTHLWSTSQSKQKTKQKKNKNKTKAVIQLNIIVLAVFKDYIVIKYTN